MDIHDLRGIMSAVLLITFIGIFIWAWIGGPKRFHDAEMLPFTDDEDADDPKAPRSEARS